MIAPGSIEKVLEEADGELPPLPEMTPEETRAMLEQALVILSYVNNALWWSSKPGSVGYTLSKLILVYLDRAVPLARLAAFKNLELPSL